MNTINYICKIVGLMALSSVLIVSCQSDQQQNERVLSPETALSQHNIQSVEVVNPEPRSFTAELLITGTAEPNQKVVLYAMESGYVQTIKKDIGDFVKKGGIIAVLKNPELSRQYEQKKAQKEAKQSIYERLNSIQEKTPALTSLQMVENAEADYLSAKAELNAIQDRLNFLHVKAPFSGIITNRMVDHGALIQSGLTEDNPQGIIELQETSPIRLTIPLPESDVAAVNKGMEVIVTFPELPGESYKAKVSRTAGALDPASKTMMVEIDIDNTDGFIKPGMYAKVLMQLSSRNEVLSLPSTAQVIHQNQFFVLVTKDGKVERIPLRKGLSSKDYFEVLNPEIAKTSMVIVKGKNLVKHGQFVKPVLKSN